MELRALILRDCHLGMYVPLRLQVWQKCLSLPAYESVGKKKFKQRAEKMERILRQNEPIWNREFHWFGSAPRKTGDVSSGANLAVVLQDIVASKDTVRGLVSVFFFYLYP